MSDRKADCMQSSNASSTADLNQMFGISNKFQIPTAISKYLTYVLVLHLVGKS